MTDFSKVTEDILERLRGIAGARFVLTDKDDVEPYTHDETEDLRYAPDVVVKPDSAAQVCAIMKLCGAARVPVTPRGGGTGLSGGALALYGGVVLSLERMNRILEIDTKNFMAVVEPGVITETLHNAVEELDLFYPPDPASRGSCTIGGNLAECAGGPRTRVFMSRVFPCAAEFMERDAVQTAEKMLERAFPYSDAAAILLLEVDGDDTDAVRRDIERAGEVCLEAGAIDVLVAESSAKQEQLWSMRRACGEAVKKFSAYREEDTVAPRAQLPELMRAIKDIAARHGITTICYGHAGDGNIHCNIVKSAMSESEWKNRLPGAITELHKIVIAMGGTLSGEHGIGCLQNNHLPLALGPAELRLMRDIKNVFDPLGILNPGKVFPDADCGIGRGNNISADNA